MSMSITIVIGVRDSNMVYLPRGSIANYTSTPAYPGLWVGIFHYLEDFTPMRKKRKVRFIRVINRPATRYLLCDIARPRSGCVPIRFTLPEPDTGSNILGAETPILHKNYCVQNISSCIHAEVLHPDLFQHGCNLRFLHDLPVHGRRLL